MPYFAFVSTNVKKKQMDFQGMQKSLPQWGKGDRDSGG